MINDLICEMLPGTNKVFRSVDELENYEDVLRFNPEYLNTLNPNGFPPHSKSQAWNAPHASSKHKPTRWTM